MINERPNSVLIWSNALATSNCIEPTLGQKVTGWSIDDEPAAEWMNWFQNTVSSYIAHLEESAAGWAFNITLDSTVISNTIYTVCTGQNSTYGETCAIGCGSSFGEYNYTFDLHEWTQGQISGVDVVVSLAYGNGYWAAVTYDAVEGNQVYYAESIFGPWTKNSSGPGFIDTIFRIKFKNNYWVLLGGGGNSSYCESVPTGAFTQNQQGSEALYDIDYSEPDDLFVLVGANGTLRYRSSDPTGAFTANDQGSENLRTITHGVIGGSTKWVTAGDNDTIYSTSIPSGSWDSRDSDLQSGLNLRDSAFGNGVFSIAARQGVTNYGGAQVSIDGDHWKKIETTNAFVACAYTINSIVYGGHTGIIARSNRHGSGN